MLTNINIRENISATYEACSPNATQRIYQIINFKEYLEATSNSALSAKAVAKAWANRVTMASGSEAVTDTFIEVAIKVHKNFFSHPDVKVLLIRGDNKYGKINNPIPSVYQLEAIGALCKSTTAKLWTLSAIYDAIDNGLATPGGFAVRLLTGKGMGNKGAIHLFNMKLDVLNALFEWASPKGMHIDHIRALRVIFNTHESYRGKVGYKHAPLNRHWQSEFPEPARKLMDVIEVGMIPAAIISMSHHCIIVNAFMGNSAPSRHWSYWLVAS